MIDVYEAVDKKLQMTNNSLIITLKVRQSTSTEDATVFDRAFVSGRYKGERKEEPKKEPRKEHKYVPKQELQPTEFISAKEMERLRFSVIMDIMAGNTQEHIMHEYCITPREFHNCKRHFAWYSELITKHLKAQP